MSSVEALAEAWGEASVEAWLEARVEAWGGSS
jgi:hypothetical protein